MPHNPNRPAAEAATLSRRNFLIAAAAASLSVAACSAPPETPPRPEGLLDPARRRAADQIVSSFEYSTTNLTYDRAEDIGDGRGITAGRIGFNSGSHDLLVVTQQYADTTTQHHNPLLRYLPALRRIDGEEDASDTKGLEGFPDAWKNASHTDPALNRAQDAIYDRNYVQPALGHARELGIRSGLGQLILLDSIVQHGDSADPDGVPSLIARTTQTNGLPGGNEGAWLHSYLEVRRDDLQHPADTDTTDVWRQSVPRVDTLEALLQEGAYDLNTPLTYTFDGEQFQVE